MNTTVRVTIVKDVEIEVADIALTSEAVSNFSAHMFDVDGPNDLIKFAAEQAVMNDSNNIEGIGPIKYYEKMVTVTTSIID